MRALGGFEGGSWTSPTLALGRVPSKAQKRHPPAPCPPPLPSVAAGALALPPPSQFPVDSQASESQLPCLMGAASQGLYPWSSSCAMITPRLPPHGLMPAASNQVTGFVFNKWPLGSRHDCLCVSTCLCQLCFRPNGDFAHLCLTDRCCPPERSMTPHVLPNASSLLSLACLGSLWLSWWLLYP
jgi:hypothetical protein